MATVNPFPGIRPESSLAAQIAALPYDVYNRHEAKVEIAAHPMSFLRIDRPETQFPDDYDMYSPKVYQRASEILHGMIKDGLFIQDTKDVYYIYSLTYKNRTQTGVVGCGSIDDYENHIIKKHENTRPGKELDRFNHIEACRAQTGPVFMAYHPIPSLSNLLEKLKKNPSLYDFVADDQVRHQVWLVDGDREIKEIQQAFTQVNSIYIADGHHRAESAANVGLIHRLDGSEDHTGQEPYNFMLGVFFAQDQLEIMDYNRYVKDLNSHETKDFLDIIKSKFTLSKPTQVCPKPSKKGEVAMYIAGNWYLFDLNEHSETAFESPVDGLDVALLQNRILAPILGIENPKTDKRIEFVGGIRGAKDLANRVDTGGGVAFAMYPTSMDELFAVADANMLMPPKSTWFEPKLRSGLFIHQI